MRRSGNTSLSDKIKAAKAAAAARQKASDAKEKASDAGNKTSKTSPEDIKSRGPTMKLLKELQSQLALFNARLFALETRPASTAPSLEITEDLVLKYSQWVLAQDPDLVPKTVKNAIQKNYRRPAEDYVRLFQAFLKTLEPEA